MELDINVPMPVLAPTGSGDFVLYDDTATGPTAPPEGSVKGTRAMSGFFTTDVSSIYKAQVWVPQANSGAGGWVTINGTAGAGVTVAANALCVFRTNRIGGRMRLIVTMSAKPTAVWETSQHVRLHQLPFATETP